MNLFRINEREAVCFNPNGRFHGWLFLQHPDGHWVSFRKLEETDPFPPGSPGRMLADVARHKEGIGPK